MSSQRSSNRPLGVFIAVVALPHACGGLPQRGYDVPNAASTVPLPPPPLEKSA